MNESRRKNPTFGVAVFIVVVVLLVIATILYNAISGKLAYDREMAATPAAPATAVSASSAAP
jgi:hypothetical protein